MRLIRHLARCDAERVQEPPHRDLRRHRRLVRAEPAQIHEQLPVREPVEVAVRPVQRQPGLAHPAAAGDGRDHHGSARGAGVVQSRQLVVASDERRGRSGQLPGHHPRVHPLTGHPRGGEFGVVVQNGVPQRPQLLAGIHAQLLAQQRRQVLVRLERLGLAAGPVQRHHQLRPQPFAQRVGLRRHQQFPDDLTVPAERQADVEPPLQRPHPLLDELRDVVAMHHFRRYVAQNRLLPQPQCLLQQVRLPGEVTFSRRPLGPPGQPAKPGQIQPVVFDVDGVSVSVRTDQPGLLAPVAQHPA